tara:strand:- start:1187 stop:1612 length:426 start_codon:yes stop_codon:yes gene_type:complete
MNVIYRVIFKKVCFKFGSVKYYLLYCNNINKHNKIIMDTHTSMDANNPINDRTENETCKDCQSVLGNYKGEMVCKEMQCYLELNDIYDIYVADIEGRDYPDFTNAYIEEAYFDGRELTDEEYDYINNDGDFVYTCIENQLY